MHRTAIKMIIFYDQTISFSFLSQFKRRANDGEFFVPIETEYYPGTRSTIVFIVIVVDIIEYSIQTSQFDLNSFSIYESIKILNFSYFSSHFVPKFSLMTLYLRRMRLPQTHKYSGRMQFDPTHYDYFLFFFSSFFLFFFIAYFKSWRVLRMQNISRGRVQEIILKYTYNIRQI